MWLHRLDYPEQADDVLTAMEQWDPNLWSSMGGRKTTSFSKCIIDSRFNRLNNRWKRLASIIRNTQIPERDRAAVSGRFYRLLSEQLYNLGRVRLSVQGENVRFSAWEKINDLHAQARPIQREGMEFLGGLLVYLAELDHEPAIITKTQEGPSICDLADGLLHSYARRTGVNWSARTVLGRNPFLETSTEVIRVRFPDWSLWNLPLMAHEFGHVTALATPAFHRYKAAEAESLKGEARQRESHLDEYFADIFAVYTFGPAFACDAILAQFNPAQAFMPRGVHPSHDERARTILATLERINEATQRGTWDDGIYGTVISQIRNAWEEAVKACLKPGESAPAAVASGATDRWARGLYRLIDTYYRFGAAYTPNRWKFAEELSDNLRGSALAPSAMTLAALAQRNELETYTLADVLNGLWLARLDCLDNPSMVDSLTQRAIPISQSVP